MLHSAVKGIANLNIIEMLIKAHPNLAYTKDNQYKTPFDHAEESIKILEYYTECYTGYKTPHDWDNEDEMLDYLLGSNAEEKDDAMFIY